jgi:hypothetical protein
MKNMLETLQDVLLVFTIVLLVYVLYKRLLVVLGKKQNSDYISHYRRKGALERLETCCDRSYFEGGYQFVIEYF